MTPSASGGGDSWRPIITPDGRYVLFASRANNLALTSSNTPFALPLILPRANVYLRDRGSQTTTLVSVNLAGTGGGSGDSIPIAVSTNGQYALFESSVGDLVPGDTNTAADVFVRDMVNGTNLLVSVSTNGGCANGSSWESAMTPDGRYVAFASTASNLVPNDTNGIQDIFVRDLQAGVTTLASPGAIAVSLSTSSSDSPRITPDGRYVAFLSSATNLVTGATNTGEVYVRDLVGGATFLVSSNAHVLISGPLAAYTVSYSHAISDDGQHVAFQSSSGGAASFGFVQRYNFQTGVTDLVSSNGINTIPSYNHVRTLDITPDGRFIAYVGSTNGAATPAASFVFVWDAQAATNTLASADLNGNFPANSLCDWPALDATGRYVAFLSTATNLTTNVVAGDFHLYVRDLQAGATELVDAGTDGLGTAKDFLSAPQITPDGRFAVFDCTDGDLVPNDNNRAYDVFVCNLSTGAKGLISVRQSALPSQTPAGGRCGTVFSVDTSGRYIAFSSSAAGLVANDTNTYPSIVVHDLLSGTNTLVSVDTNGAFGADGFSTDPSISGDGRYVAFTSSADNLVANGKTNVQSVFVRDLQLGTTVLASGNASGSSPSSGITNANSPMISNNGRYVLFRTSTTSFAAPQSQFFWLRDMQAGTNYTLAPRGVSTATLTPDGYYVAYSGRPGATPYFFVWDSRAAAIVYTNAMVLPWMLAISPDGNRIVYSGTNGFVVGGTNGFYAIDRSANTSWMIGPPLSGSHLGMQFSGDARLFVYATATGQVPIDTNSVSDVYLYDFQTRTNILISQNSDGSGAGNGFSDSPAISSDGRFVAYRSAASNIVAGVSNGVPNIYLYDRQSGVTTVLAPSIYGNLVGNNRSLAPQFSGDGQTLVFLSWASDLVAQDFNQGADLFALRIGTANPAPAFAGQVVFVPTSGQSPTLTWPTVTSKSYQVQYKDSLSDAVWQPLTGNVWVVGNQGYATDLAPNPVRRFYRIAAF